MYDLFKEQWDTLMRRLVRDRANAFPVVLLPQPNQDAEHLTCILCDHGHEEDRPPPEWLVTLRIDAATIMKGLHESCRARHARWAAVPAAPGRRPRRVG